MNLPNRLTVLRMFLVIPFIIVMILASHYIHTNAFDYSFLETSKAEQFLLVGGIIFVLAMITDWADGYLARKNNQVSTFGKLFDPLADKFMTTSALVLLSIIGYVPVWLTLIFILRDILVDGSRNVAAKNNVEVSASIWGKVKTALQSVGIPLLIFIAPVISVKGSPLFDDASPALWVLNIPLFGAGILSVFSGFNYFKAIVPYIKVK